MSLCLLLICLNACKLGEGLEYFVTHYKGLNKTPRLDINASTAPFLLTKGSLTMQQKIANVSITPRRKDGPAQSVSLQKYLDEMTTTAAFVVLRNDTILYEQYFEGMGQASKLPSFSVAKSFTSALVGIAVGEGKIKSVHDLVSDYIPELKKAHPNFKKLTIEHLLNMRSGIKFNEESYVNPFASVAALYMHRNILNKIKRAKFKAEPGAEHYYSSFDSAILGLVVQRATGKLLADYLREKIWEPLGMEYDAQWSIDSKRKKAPEAYCCLNAAARDFAKFGLLYLNKGRYNGQQIVPEAWVEKSTQPDFDNGCYQYQWYSGNKRWEYQKENDEYVIIDGRYQIQTYPDSMAASQNLNPYQRAVYSKRRDAWIKRSCGPDFFALGILEQEIYVDPVNHLVFVRLGKKWDTRNGMVFNQIKKSLLTN